ncbi:hypothetical protein [Flavobacterium akiainvivens]|nr:hypothetical protein [Flavobacterium akiainvivens]
MNKTDVEANEKGIWEMVCVITKSASLQQNFLNKTITIVALEAT